MKKRFLNAKLKPIIGILLLIILVSCNSLQAQTDAHIDYESFWKKVFSISERRSEASIQLPEPIYKEMASAYEQDSKKPFEHAYRIFANLTTGQINFISDHHFIGRSSQVKEPNDYPSYSLFIQKQAKSILNSALIGTYHSHPSPRIIENDRVLTAGAFPSYSDLYFYKDNLDVMGPIIFIGNDKNEEKTFKVRAFLNRDYFDLPMSTQHLNSFKLLASQLNLVKPTDGEKIEAELMEVSIQRKFLHRENIHLEPNLDKLKPSRSRYIKRAYEKIIFYSPIDDIFTLYNRNNGMIIARLIEFHNQITVFHLLYTSQEMIGFHQIHFPSGALYPTYQFPLEIFKTSSFDETLQKLRENHELHELLKLKNFLGNEKTKY